MTPENTNADIERAKDEIRAEAARLVDRPRLERIDPRARMSAGSDGIDRAKQHYRIGELTDLHHVAFVDHAFRALLKRFPDSAEAGAQLRLLASGASKPEVLGNLRYSTEGRRVNVRVDGLFPRYAMAKLRRVPVIGYVIDWALTLAGLPLIVRHQRATEALFAAGDHAAAEADRALAARIEQLAATDTALREWLNGLQIATSNLETGQRAIADAINSSSKLLNDRYDEMAFLRQRLYSLNHWGHSLTQAFARIDEVAQARATERDAFAARTALLALDADRARAVRNEAWLRELAARLPTNAEVMSLAAGSDWCAALGTHGARVLSIEPNRTLAEAFARSGVTVDRVQAAEALRRIEDASLDALTILALPSVLRHMPLADLLAEARRVLRAGGSLLFAFAREPAAIVDELLEPAVPSPDPALLEHALVIAGFAEPSRIDAADGTVALLASNPSR